GVELPRAIGARDGAPRARLLAARAGPSRAGELGVLDVGDVSSLRARARWRVARTVRRGPLRDAAPAVDRAPAGERRARRGAGGGDARGGAAASIRSKSLRSNRPNGSRSNDRRSILDPRGRRLEYARLIAQAGRHLVPRRVNDSKPGSPRRVLSLPR